MGRGRVRVAVCREALLGHPPSLLPPLRAKKTIHEETVSVPVSVTKGVCTREEQAATP